MTEYYDALETRDPVEREAALIQAVVQQVAHAKQHTPAYAELLKDVDPTQLTSKAAIAQLPLTRKSDLNALQKAQRPLGGLAAVGGKALTHIFASPGPIYEPGSKRPDFWRLARALFSAGFREGDVVHNTFSYHLTPAGMMLESGAHALGCTVIPAGVGQTELQVQTIADLQPSGYVGTPSFLKIILEKAAELGADVSSLKRGLVSGEALPPSVRAKFAEQGIEVLQAYATADLGLIAYETSAKEGLVIDEGVYVEIVRPGTGDLVPDGEVGEVVVTSLNPDYPLIRFATGDLSAIMAGLSPCGRTNRRIKGWMGRADQTAKVRGMFIHPSQVDKVVKRHSEIQKARLVVDWQNESDQLTLKCEVLAPNDALKQAISESVRDICKLRAEVEWIAVGSLPNDGVVISDIRKYD
ncbi:MAG: AMP-binding protein [Thiofilum sp.]|uniref:phenylacetate--CoA ligase family protein n=1 Tax=Thiofilum sp. TaxID=2212733 RepID=UPI0025E9B22B|nr:AMP-binding protein [Thiofilum sp.]MBK8452155.1 AMP-binding protein [Thiofilum sp.]